MSTGKPAAKARPRQVSVPSSSSSSTSIPIHSRKWIDVEPGEQHARSYPIAKKMNTLLRHEPIPRDEDGAIEFRRLNSAIRVEIFQTPYIGRIRSWKSQLERGGGHKKIFGYCTDSTGTEILYLRAIQGHSGENPVDQILQDSVLIPNDFFEYIYHVTNNLNVYSIIASG